VLSTALAKQSFYYSVAIRGYMANPANAGGRFYIKFGALFKEYQQSIHYHYEFIDFYDIYAQSLVYGLLLAYLDTGQKFNEQTLDYLLDIPLAYKLLCEFLAQAYEPQRLPTALRVALVNIGKNLNLIDSDSIRAEFDRANGGNDNVAVYLYEDFLAGFDALR
jgi:hypothetical protein